MYHEVLRDRVAYMKSSEEYIMNISAAAQRIYDNGKREWDKEKEELNRQLALKDKKLEELNRQLALKDKKLEELNRQIEDLKHHILGGDLAQEKG